MDKLFQKLNFKNVLVIYLRTLKVLVKPAQKRNQNFLTFVIFKSFD